MKNRCDLAIEFDNPSRQYRTGDQVSGFVTVEVNKDCRCRGLSVDCEWRTHGRGNRSRGSTRTAIVFEGEWTAGVYRYPFSFIIPNGPVSYHGHLLNVDWYLRARADIPWSFDPREEVDFIVDPGIPRSNEPYLTGDPNSHSHSSLEQRVASYKAGSSALFFVIGIVLFAVAAFMCVMMVLTGISAVAILMAIFHGALAILFLSIGLQRRMAIMKFGDIQIEIPQKRIHAGGIVDLRLDIPPSSKGRLNKVTASISCAEVVTSGSGTNRTTRTHTLLGDSHVFESSVNRTLRKGESAQFSHRFRLPENAPPSFHTYNNHITWKIEFHVDIARWPDWVEARPLEVVPALLKAPKAEPVNQTQNAVW